MTRYAMVADLNRCVGCQTCTASCKHANNTHPDVQWRKVLDIESGVYPDVRRTFVPVGCMHCDEPPCMHVCPSTATRKRDDGIVTIDYDICIGCAYCAVACPYQARYKVQQPRFAYGKGKQMAHEKLRDDPARLGVAQKCTFCTDKVDAGRAAGLTPGIDPDATPACVNSCIADALHFGDVEDPSSNVSKLLAENENFRMHEEVETGPRFYYLWRSGLDGSAPKSIAPGSELEADTGAHTIGVAPKLQSHWDLRAAGNFMGGGAGTGLYLAAAVAASFGLATFRPLAFLGLVLVGLGLLCVWLEIGRPWRFLNVFRNPNTSWMTREAFVSVVFMGAGFLAILLDHTGLGLVAAAIGMAFLYCQGRILTASKGVPAWREPKVLPLIILTGLTEGVGLFLFLADWANARGALYLHGAVVLIGLAAIRHLTWLFYRHATLISGLPEGAMDSLDRLAPIMLWAGLAIPVALAALGLFAPPAGALMIAVAGIVAFIVGWWFKIVLVTQAAFDQGFAIERTPARGSGTAGPGIKPGWVRG